jgi:hypothetical protein
MTAKYLAVLDVLLADGHVGARTRLETHVTLHVTLIDPPSRITRVANACLSRAAGTLAPRPFPGHSLEAQERRLRALPEGTAVRSGMQVRGMGSRYACEPRSGLFCYTLGFALRSVTRPVYRDGQFSLEA